MSRQRNGIIIKNHLLVIIVVAMAICTVSAYAQYNGECWAVDYYNAFKISANGQATTIQGFSQPLSLSINTTDGSVWIADTDAVRVRKLSAAGQDILELNSTSTPPAISSQPRSVAVDPNDGSCWVADFYNVYKFSADGKQLAKLEGYNEPSLAVNPKTSECWVADSNSLRVQKLSSDAKVLSTATTSGKPNWPSVSAADDSCWVLDTDNRKAIKLSADGKIAVQADLAPADVILMASTSICATPDGGCWVGVMVDMMNDWVIKLSPAGKQTLKVDGFSMPSGLAADPKDGGCWVANTDMMNPAGGSVVKLAANGQKTVTIPGFYQPKALTVGK